MAKKEKQDVDVLRFASREEEDQLIEQGRVAPRAKERPVNRDVIDHPEKYYCPTCGASFASHLAQGCTQ